MRAVILCLCLLAPGLAACGDNIHPEQARPAREIVSGGARLRGGGIRMDVQVGRALAQTPVRANGAAARPAAVVTP